MHDPCAHISNADRLASMVEVAQLIGEGRAVTLVVRVPYRLSGFPLETVRFL
jgi:hypothetical protein